MAPLSLLKPRYWLLWVGAGIFWCLTRLPHRGRLAVGRQIGRLAYPFASRRRTIAHINLKQCFPELNDTQRNHLLRQHFESLGMGLIESLSAWWLPDAALKPLEHIEGFEHLQAALESGNGVILLGAHFTSLEIGLRFLTMHTAIHGVYHPHKNPLIEYFMKQNRESRAEKAIPRYAVRDMLRSLKQNKPLWFATDQNSGHKHSVFANFFGIPAATNTAASRLAQLTSAKVVPFFMLRLENNQGYQIILQAALEHFPSGDYVQDMSRINQLIEEQVKKFPEQYLWVHRRFKDRPKGLAKFYE